MSTTFRIMQMIKVLTDLQKIIFNASRPTSNGTCTNTLLHSGAKLQNELTTVLLRKRFFRIVFCVDIDMMYHQVLPLEEMDIELSMLLR